MILANESRMRLVVDARTDANLVHRELAALYLLRLRHFRRRQRDELVGPLEIVILKWRLVDLAREERLVHGVGLHRIEVLRPLHERGVKDVGGPLGARIRIVPDLAAARQKQHEHQEDAHVAQYNRPMALLSGKKILVTGVISNRSIAHGVAKAARREGAEIALTYQNDRFKDRVVEMAKELGSDIALPCEVTSDEEIQKLFSDLKQHWKNLDGLVHAIAFAPREAITGDFLDGISREAFRQAHDISAY